jgi:ATP-binding cassette, subfamily B, bacterial
MRNRMLSTVLSFTQPHFKALLLGALLLVVESAVTLAVPYVGGKMAESLAQGASTERLGHQLLIAALALITMQALLRITNQNVLGAVAVRMLGSLRTRLYDHLQSLPIAFFQGRKQGDVVSVLMYDVAVVSTYLSGALTSLLAQLITLAGSLVLMWRLDPRLTLVALALIPLFYLLLKVVGRSLRPLATAEAEAYAAAFSITDENVAMIPAIKSFTREAFESKRYAAASDRLMELALRQQRIESALGPGAQWLASLGILGILWFAQDRIGAGSLSTGGLVAFLMYSATLSRPVSGMADFYGRTQHARAALNRVLDVMDTTPESSTTPVCTSPSLAPLKQSIEFKNVSFAYPGRAPVLSNFNLQVKAGETLAITGENGAGKSTLMQLLLRFYKPTSGAILVDGVDIETINLTSLRTQIAIVPQLTLLFNGTVYGNIAYGRSDATSAEIHKAAALAQAERFIAALPDGYDTLIGDQGIRLSGGQRQRISLARALLKDPPILILDEATSMFDPEGEASFIESCGEVLRNRTVIIITHRPAALALADRVILVSDSPDSI